MQSAKRLLAITAATAALSSCGTFSPAVKFDSVELHVEKLQNGYLVEILTENPVGEVSTLVTRPYWLIVTIADTLLDTIAVAAYRSAIVDSTEVRRFETATQFAVRMTKPISSAEVISTAERRKILISVFF